jgi:hypothetical protein
MLVEAQPTLGDLLPSIVALGVAVLIAKCFAYFRLVTLKNVNKWAIFSAVITGITYGVYMMPYIKVKNEFLYFIAPFVFAIFGGFISWMFYYFAFAIVAKKEDE